MSLRIVRAVVIAAVLLTGLAPVLGTAPSALAQDDPALAAAATGPTGYDISWPQCGGSYPANPAFGIVGVNAGIVFSPNPCLASEVAWAGGVSAGLYANTGNPGPAISKHWPTGQLTPRWCDPVNTDTADCAYDYGYNAAADSYADAVAAFSSLGLAGTPAGSVWWFDVETGNSWRSDVSLNVAALEGAAYYLGSVAKVASIGFYSTQYQWNVITGGTSTFAANQSWVAGASDAQGASANCTGSGFTGGGVALAQYPSGGFDADVRCTSAPSVLTTITVSPTSASVQTGGTQPFSATGLDQFGQPMNPQPAFIWSASGGGSISASGMFTAGSTAGGPFTVSASSGSVNGTASVTVTGVTADFSLSVGPTAFSVRRGGTATYTVTINPTNGFNGSVTLSLTGQPSGSAVTFTPNPGTTTSTLTVKTLSTTSRRSYSLTITGKSGSLTHTATASLTVTK